MIAYFLPRVWQWVKGIVPTYWPVKVFWMLAEGEADWWPYLAIAALYQSLILVLCCGDSGHWRAGRARESQMC